MAPEKLVRNGLGSAPEVANPCLRRGRDLDALWVRAKTDDDIALRDCGCQEPIRIRDIAQFGTKHCVTRRLRPMSQDPAGGSPVGLGKQHVEYDGGRAGIRQIGEQPRDKRPRPRPLTQTLKAFVVDIDHSDRHVRRRSRFYALKGIENAMPGIFQNRRIDRTQKRCKPPASIPAAPTAGISSWIVDGLTTDQQASHC